MLYKILKTIGVREDGRTVYCRPGGDVEITDKEEAARLIAAGVIKIKGAEAPAADGAQKPEGDALIEAIADAIDGLDPEEGFTKAGDPSVPALRQALGYEITAAERDDGAARLAERKAGGDDGLGV